MSISILAQAHRAGGVQSRVLGVGLALVVVLGSIGWLLHSSARRSVRAQGSSASGAGSALEPSTGTGRDDRIADLRAALARYGEKDATTLAAYTVYALSEAALLEARGQAVGLDDPRVNDDGFVRLLRYGRVYLVKRTANPFLDALHEAVFAGGDPFLQSKSRAPDGTWAAPWLTPERDREVRQHAVDALAILAGS